ncbi:MAG: hypothetical protein LBH37_02700 [Oscillospiraceae bacterium]|jgi:hypothetical protein|nr:hypothetical protein [Oscillospiraceae bacterium]
MMKSRYSWIPFSAAILFLVPFGIYIGLSSARNIVPTFAGTDSLPISLIVMLSCLVCTLVFSHLSQDAMAGVIIDKNLFLSAASVLCGLAVFWGGVMHFSVSMPDHVPSFLRVLNAVLGMANGLVFVIFGFFVFLGSNFFEDFPILAIIPPIWSFTRLYERNVILKDDTGMSIEIYDILCLAMLVFFFIYQSKMLVGAGIGRSRIKESSIVFGMAGFLCNAFFLCNKVSKKVGENSLKGEDLPSIFVDLSVLIYVFAFLFYISFFGRDRMKEEEIEESIEGDDA